MGNIWDKDKVMEALGNEYDEWYKENFEPFKTKGPVGIFSSKDTFNRNVLFNQLIWTLFTETHKKEENDNA